MLTTTLACSLRVHTCRSVKILRNRSKRHMREIFFPQSRDSLYRHIAYRVCCCSTHGAWKTEENIDTCINIKKKLKIKTQKNTTQNSRNELVVLQFFIIVWRDRSSLDRPSSWYFIKKKIFSLFFVLSRERRTQLQLDLIVTFGKNQIFLQVFFVRRKFLNKFLGKTRKKIEKIKVKNYLIYLMRSSSFR